MDEGFSFAGSKAYLADRIMSVKETIGQIMQEYTDAKQLALLKLNAAGA